MKQSSVFARLGLLRCARNDEGCILMHDFCLTGQPLYLESVSYLKTVPMGRRFLPQAKEVPKRLVYKASKEALTQDCGKKTAAAGLLSGAMTLVQ
ncbi:MAG: hypothetical protein FWE42_09875 [Defluviitaleaceae bacterium]|nr:hypothetical protein [Defluviitaleaceae bacterium]